MRKQFTTILFFLFITILSTFPGYSQFQKTVDFSGDDYANVAIMDANGNSYLAGSTTATGGGGYDAYLAKISSTGTPIWQKQYGGSGTEFGTFALSTDDGNILLVGRSNSYSASQDMFVVKADSNGTVLWAKTFGTDSIDYGIRATEDNNGYLIVGQTKGAPNAINGRLDMLLVYVDFNGNEKWSKVFGTAYANEVPYDVLSMGGDGFIVGGYTGVNLIGLNDGGVFILDTAGNFQGGFLSGGQGDDDYRVILPGDNSAFFVGNTNAFSGGGGADFMVAKYNVSGGLPTFQWLKKYGGSQNESLSNAQILPDGNIIMIGHTTSFGTGGDALVVVIDTNGAVLVSKSFGGTGDDFLLNGTFGNTGALFVGNTNSFGGTQNDVYLVSPDQTGNTPCNSAAASITPVAMADTSIGPVLADFASDTVTITVTTQTLTAATNAGTLADQCFNSVAAVDARLELALYPNPASNFTELVVYCDKAATASINVTNYVGQTVKVLNAEMNAGKNMIRLDVNEFASGNYYVKVSTSEGQGVLPLSVR